MNRSPLNWISSLRRRRVTALLVGVLLAALALAGGAGATHSTGSARISAHLTETTFTSSQAGLVELDYWFSNPSKSFAYRLSIKKGEKWQLVKKVKTVKKAGSFKGQRKSTVKKLFAGKPIRIGDYRLKLSVDTRSELLGFTVVKAGIIASRLSAGDSYTCAVVSGGTIKCWGLNYHGQLGDGTTTSRSTPVRVREISNAADVSAAYSHTCALLSNGTIECWGFGTDKTLPVQVSEIANATAISAGGWNDIEYGSFSHTCALISGGTVECWDWGSDENRPLAPAQVLGVTKAVAISSGGGDGYACALIEDGTVECWSNHTAPVRVSGIANATQISEIGGSRFDYACALLSGGTIKCWSNWSSWIGGSSIPSRVSGIASATAISVGGALCALLSNGTIKCWGENSRGQLGDGTTEGRSTPVRVRGISNAVSIDAGTDHTCAVLKSGTIKCWGGNHNGQLGDGTTTNRKVPVRVVGE